MTRVRRIGSVGSRSDALGRTGPLGWRLFGRLGSNGQLGGSAGGSKWRRMAGVGRNGAPGLGSNREKAEEGEESTGKLMEGSRRWVGAAWVAHGGDAWHGSSGEQYCTRENEEDEGSGLVATLTHAQCSCGGRPCREGGGAANQRQEVGAQWRRAASLLRQAIGMAGAR